MQLDRISSQVTFAIAKHDIVSARAALPDFWLGHASWNIHVNKEGLQNTASKMCSDGAVVLMVCHGGAILPELDAS